MHVQTVVPPLPIKRLNECIFYGFPQLNERQLNVVSLGPIFHGLVLQFLPVINRDGARYGVGIQHTIEYLTNDHSQHSKSCL